MSNIFFDLDGTLINSEHRLYNLFVELCPNCNMTYEEYWKIKRQRYTQKNFLKKYFNFTDIECENFHKTYLLKVEEEKRLEEDFLKEGVIEVLQKLYKKYDLYVVTNRQSKELTLKELEKFNIKQYFKDILVTEQKITKVDLIKKNVQISHIDVMIGDTGEDIKCAKALGIKSIAISWGVLNKEILKEYSPNGIIDEVMELENHIIQ